MTTPSLATTVKGRGRHYPDDDGVYVPSITNVLDLLDKSGPLMWWGSRTVTENIADNLGEFVDTTLRASRDKDKRYDSLKPWIGHYNKRRDAAADAGTSVHEWLELGVKYQESLGVDDLDVMQDARDAWQKCEDELSADARRFLPAARDFMAEQFPRGITEQTVLGGVKGHTRYGGTLDLRGTIGEHRNVVCDFKTRGNNKHDVYEKEALQLAAQRHGTLAATDGDDGDDGPEYSHIEKADGAVLVTFTPTNGYVVHPMTEVTGDDTFGCFLSLVRTWGLFHDVKDAMKARAKR